MSQQAHEREILVEKFLAANKLRPGGEEETYHRVTVCTSLLTRVLPDYFSVMCSGWPQLANSDGSMFHEAMEFLL